MADYIIEQRKSGFHLYAKLHPLDTPDQSKAFVDFLYEETRARREPVEVRLNPYWLEAASSLGSRTFGFYQYPDLINTIAETLMDPWKPPRREHEYCDEEEHHVAHLRDWVVKKTERVINKRVHAEWERLLAQIDPTVLAVHKKVFSSAWGYGRPRLLTDDALYSEKYVIKDILAYRAAAVATLACYDIGPANETPIERMRHWRDLFAPAGMKSYHALNATLMNLPGSIPAPLLVDLPQPILPRPIHNRLELITTILAGTRTTDNFAVFAHATAAEIKEAMRRIDLSLQAGWGDLVKYEHLSPRRTRDIRRAVLYMLDYPEDHHGRILGLAEKAIRWHGLEGREREMRRAVKRFGTGRLTAKPPIPLPQIEGVRFLETVEDVVNEAGDMSHCIASYSEDAIDGRCYLFHVEYKGEKASVEVSPCGRVEQAHGPHNCWNGAARWATRVLGQWGLGFSDEDAAKRFALMAGDPTYLEALAPVVEPSPLRLADEQFLRELQGM